MLAGVLSNQLEVGQPRGRYAFALPAVDRRNGGLQKLCNGSCAAQFFHGAIGQSLHEPQHAIIAIAMQAESCDSRDCDEYGFAFDSAMDVAQLKQLMAEWGEKQSDIARLLQITPDKVNKIIKGKRRITAAEADVLRRYFGVKEEEAGVKPRRLPIVGLVSAGMWREGFEQILGWMPSPDPSLGKDAFVVIIEGDSMDLIAQPGEAVIIDPSQRELVNGGLYIVRNMHGETTFKQYRENPARLEPCSSNEAHTTLYPGQEGFEVIGRARKKVTNL